MVITVNKVNFANQINDMELNNAKCRDPNGITKNSKFIWSSIVGEPENLQTPEIIWKIASTCFTYTQSWTYKFLTIIFAPIVSFVIAIHFAILSFLQIWFAIPVLKFLHSVFASIRTLLQILTTSLLGPIVETVGLCFSKLKIRHQRIYDAKDEPKYQFII